MTLIVGTYEFSCVGARMKVVDSVTGEVIAGEGRHFRNAAAAVLQGLAAGSAAGRRGLKWMAGYMASHFKTLWRKIKNGWHWCAGQRSTPAVDLSSASAAELSAAAKTGDQLADAVFEGVVREIERRRRDQDRRDQEQDRREQELAARESAVAGPCPA